MADNTIIQQGRFTSTGATKSLSIRSDVDWMVVYNETALAQAASDLGAKFYWQRGMANGRGVVYTKLGTVANDPLSIGQIAANAGFTLVDSSGDPLAAANAMTSSTSATRPVFTLGASAASFGLVSGDVVRIYGMTGQVNLNGYDFTIDDLDAGGGNNFRWAATLATAPGVVGAGGFFRKIKFDPLFYPRHRYIVNISQAPSAVITLSVPSGYEVGQQVRVIVPETSQAGISDYGMVEINGLIGTVTDVDNAVGTQSITLDIDTSSGFSMFTFPTAAKAAVPLSKAMVVPVGEDTAYALAQSQDILSDATDNQGFLGMNLAAGTLSPAGQNADVVYWVAGKSFSVNNE